MFGSLLSIDDSLKLFFGQLTEAIGFGGYLGLIIGVELLFVLLFAIKTIFSYEYRLKKILDKSNEWLFKNKVLKPENIKEFNDIVKKGPKRFAYYWQQFILNREGGPIAYMTEENIIEKPLRTSSWKNNVKNLGILTGVWAVIAFMLGLGSQSSATFSFSSFAIALLLPSIVLLIGLISIIAIKGKRVLNLDEIYHLYHIFSRFVTNACDELPPYIDFNLLFERKEIENGNAQIREYYEKLAREAKEAFEEASQSETHTIDYNFRGVGVDGALLLERAMKESDAYLTTKNATLSRIAQVEAQKEALRRGFEEKQMDFQRKLQASKENMEQLIEEQNTTTDRFGITRLRERQDKEVKRQEQIQIDLDHEEAKFNSARDELDKEIEELSRKMVKSLDKAEKGMTAEYQSFFKKVLKSAYAVADSKIKSEKKTLIDERNNIESELINVQTQIKRLLDENITLRDRLNNLSNDSEKQQTENKEESLNGDFDDKGNFIYNDGSFHDAKGLFHDVDGRIYDMNGVLVDESSEQDSEEVKEEDIINDQLESFGHFFSENEIEEKEEEAEEDDKKGRGRPRKIIDESAAKDEPKKGRGRPRKINDEQPISVAPKKKGRPRKIVSEDELENINNLISAEEAKFNEIKAIVDNSIDEALELDEGVERDKEEIISAVEMLKEQAKELEGRDDAGDELKKINARIETLINDITSLSGKK